MEIDISSLIIQCINLAIIIFVLRKFFFSSYIRYLDEEEKKRLKVHAELEKSDHIVRDAHNQAENIIDQAKVDAKLMASEITENARKEATEIVSKAHADADAARKKGFDDIAHEKKMIQEELKTKVIDIALKMNEKLFSQSDSHIDFLKTQSQNIEF